MKYLLAIPLAVALTVFASPASESDMTEAQAEKLYLLCDKVSASEGMDPGEAATCSIAYEILLQKKFHGDFNAFLAWWKAHKNA